MQSNDFVGEAIVFYIQISKSFDNSAAISKFKSLDEFKDIENIDFSLSKNSIKIQSGNSKLMIFKIEYLIHYISYIYSLHIVCYILYITFHLLHTMYYILYII